MSSLARSTNDSGHLHIILTIYSFDISPLNNGRICEMGKYNTILSFGIGPLTHHILNSSDTCDDFPTSEIYRYFL